MILKPRQPLLPLLRKVLEGALLLSVLGYGNAWATVTIPEALSSGQQLGADAENQTGGSLADMQNGVTTTTGASGGGTTAITGVSNTQAVGNPANGADAESGATASGSYNFTLNCNSNNQKNPISPGDYELFAANCTYSGSGASAAVSGLTLYYCTAGITGGDCAEGSSNWQATGIGPGQTVQIVQGVNVTLNNCPANDSGSCTGTVAVSNSTMHTSANLTNDATSTVVTGQNGANTMLANTYNSGNYQTAIQTANSTDQLNSCTQQIKGGLNGNGIVYTCNGQQQANFNSTNCKSTQQCVKWATQSESYTQSCNENIPLTEKVCTTNTPTQNCTITDPTAQYTCDITNTVSVSISNLCNPGQWYPLASLTYAPAGLSVYTATLSVQCNPGVSYVDMDLSLTALEVIECDANWQGRLSWGLGDPPANFSFVTPVQALSGPGSLTTGWVSGLLYEHSLRDGFSNGYGPMLSAVATLPSLSVSNQGDLTGTVTLAITAGPIGYSTESGRHISYGTLGGTSVGNATALNFRQEQVNISYASTNGCTLYANAS